MKDYYSKHYQQLINHLSKPFRSELNSTKQAEIRSKILSSISQIPQDTETPTENSRFIWQGWTNSYARYALVTVIIILVGISAAQAANSAQPGDKLYPVKLLAENIELGIAIRAEKKAELQVQIAERRLEESLELLIYTVEIPVTEKNQDKQNSASENSQANEAHNSQSQGNDSVAKSARKLTVEQAKAQATASQQRFSQAMETLKATQTKLEKKGNQQAAEALKHKIERLQAKAQTAANSNKNN